VSFRHRRIFFDTSGHNHRALGAAAIGGAYGGA
jgi:hypothetical protein